MIVAVTVVVAVTVAVVVAVVVAVAVAVTNFVVATGLGVNVDVIGCTRVVATVEIIVFGSGVIVTVFAGAVTVVVTAALVTVEVEGVQAEIIARAKRIIPQTINTFLLKLYLHPD